MENIIVFGEEDYRNMFRSCSPLTCPPEPERVTVPATKKVETDCFDWDEDFRRAYTVEK